MAAKMTTTDSIEGLNRALRSLDPEARREMTEAGQEIAETVAGDARSRAAEVGRSYRLLGATIKAERSSKPGIKLGGAKRIPGRHGKGQTVGDLLWGTEFGGRGRPSTQQFLPHRGTLGYALWPAVRDNAEDTMRTYSAHLADALDRMAP